MQSYPWLTRVALLGPLLMKLPLLMLMRLEIFMELDDMPMVD